MILHVARLPELDPRTLYALLRLRVDVFVVEQHCPYPELDGLDLEDRTRHVWFSPPDDADDPYAYLRLRREPDADWIGRVCTAPKARGTGLGGRLMSAALGLATPDAPIRLNAQSHLVDFYTRYGFAPCGPQYVEDDIPHTPMVRQG